MRQALLIVDEATLVWCSDVAYATMPPHLRWDYEPETPLGGQCAGLHLTSLEVDQKLPLCAAVSVTMQAEIERTEESKAVGVA